MTLFDDILNESLKIKDSGITDGFCHPDCVPCLVAKAKGIVDNKRGIKMSNSDFLLGMRGIPTMESDHAMMQVIKHLEKK